MISFIIPTLNEEKTIGATLECLKGFSGKSEIIVSDGKSTDATITIAKQYTDLIVVHDAATRQTISGGRNAGAASAQGTFLVFVDADVTIPDINNFFTRAENYFSKDEKLVGITVQYKVLPGMATWVDRIIFKCVGISFLLLNNVFHIGGAGGEFQMIRTKAFRAIGGFNEAIALSEDADLFQRLTTVGTTKYVGSLHIFHTGRRAHAVGWPKLLSQWILGWISLVLFKKSYVKEWKQVR